MWVIEDRDVGFKRELGMEKTSHYKTPHAQPINVFIIVLLFHLTPFTQNSRFYWGWGSVLFLFLFLNNINRSRSSGCAATSLQAIN